MSRPKRHLSDPGTGHLAAAVLTRQTHIDSPEQRLWHAAMVDAAMWACKPDSPRRDARQHIIDQCRDWWAGEGWEVVSAILGIDTDYGRAVIRKARSYHP